MKLISQTVVNIEWTDVRKRVHRCPPNNSHVRTPGVHLSGVLRHIPLESGILQPRTTPQTGNVESTSSKGNLQDIDEDVMPLRMVLGTFFEDGVVGFYPEMQWQPGELERDRIFGTPDGLSVFAGSVAEQVIQRISGQAAYLLEEFKLTWKSEWNYGGDRFCSANWMWMRQALGYLALLQHNGLDVALLAQFHVCWVCGDYRPPSPKYVRYLVEFTQKEIDSLWSLVLKHKNDKGVVREG
jgi:hypothetical protein